MGLVEEFGLSEVFENDDVIGTANINFVDDRESQPKISDPNLVTSTQECGATVL